MAKLINDTKVITNEVRFSYTYVFTPKEDKEGKEKKYSTSLLIDKNDTETLGKIKKAIENAKKIGVAKFGGKVPKDLKTPLRDGDEEREDDENYKGCYFLNANCKTKPGILDKKSKLAITDSTEFYSGCYGCASITFYAYNTNGNKGIACGLNNILKTRDGECLGGRSRAEDDFADFLEDAFDDDSFLE